MVYLTTLFQLHRLHSVKRKNDEEEKNRGLNGRKSATEDRSHGDYTSSIGFEVGTHRYEYFS